ncbi:MAG: hypothetical protein LRY41_01900, partial [Candidatus Pacebacteria bacterium]|nr:hypothetical protein [Candidatus Paceibacterota bacterium]
KNLDPELYKKTKVESLFFNGHNRQEDGEPAIDFFYRGYVDAIPLPKHLAYVEDTKIISSSTRYYPASISRTSSSMRRTQIQCGNRNIVPHNHS